MLRDAFQSSLSPCPTCCVLILCLSLLRLLAVTAANSLPLARAPHRVCIKVYLQKWHEVLPLLQIEPFVEGVPAVKYDVQRNANIRRDDILTNTNNYLLREPTQTHRRNSVP